ncbi:acyl-CoA N-acyltransferase [Melanomma pulvis-pyrius CBS 109.77]|uniref:Acyl-CoA N-acyltransferase n=1 Tax=Melanomma pulvis-pyrius CBS 109.77 TaxID=1314802 RepID=A0A6A6X3P0_9PLEO|nr:acyl-CoA N-acyltransferase [Melanomma pulvis-pyrius CBS 109.77]
MSTPPNLPTLPPSLASILIPTARLTLIPFNPSLDSHCDFLVALYNSPEVAHANKDVARSIPDRATARRILEENRVSLLSTGYGKFIVTLNPDISSAGKDGEAQIPVGRTGTFIGGVGLKVRKAPGVATVPDIGFSLLRPFWGKGYATEAAQGLLDYFERERGVKDVLGFCHPANENSKKMFRRLGFENRGVRDLEGLGPEGVVVKGVVWAKKGMSEDLGVYGL